MATTGKTPRKRAAVKATAKKESGEPKAASKNMLSAGLKALTNAHEEAVARQSRVFESLLGMSKGIGKSGAAEEATAKTNPLAAVASNPFGFKKFEDVFDQRVARTLQRLGYPTPEAHAALQAEVEALRAELARVRSPGSKR